MSETQYYKKSIAEHQAKLRQGQPKQVRVTRFSSVRKVS